MVPSPGVVVGVGATPESAAAVSVVGVLLVPSVLVPFPLLVVVVVVVVLVDCDALEPPSHAAAASATVSATIADRERPSVDGRGDASCAVSARAQKGHDDSFERTKRAQCAQGISWVADMVETVRRGSDRALATTEANGVDAR